MGKLCDVKMGKPSVWLCMASLALVALGRPINHPSGKSALESTSDVFLRLG